MIVIFLKIYKKDKNNKIYFRKNINKEFSTKIVIKKKNYIFNV